MAFNSLAMFRPQSVDWSANDLAVNYITVVRHDAVTFFGRELGSIDHLDPNLLATTDPTVVSGFSKDAYRFLAYLDQASNANHGQESAIHDFAKSVLEVTGFDEVGTILSTRYDIPFTVHGDNSKTVRPDVCLVHHNSLILLVVQVDKNVFNPSNPEPRVIANAIAAFQYNNQRRSDLDLPVLHMMTIPCITMVGTRPFFYLVPVTKYLGDSIALGQRPTTALEVRRCALPQQRRASVGMEDPEYRRTALQYFDAFHALAKSCWTEILDGYD